MALNFAIFIGALIVLLLSARLFTSAAEKIGYFFKLPPFVIGVFIVGIGTSLPELISGILSVQKGVSEILPGNVIGANISNLLLITGLAVVVNRKNITLKSDYIYIDLHFLLGSFLYFYIIAFDGKIFFLEAFIGIIIYAVYAIYLIKGDAVINETKKSKIESFPWKSLAILLGSAIGIYLGADNTISALSKIASFLNIPNSIIALTALSLGTSLPELAVNISAIRQGKAEMAVGNILGSCVFNTFVIPSLASMIGQITVPDNLLRFPLPLMAASGLLFYLLTQDKRISVWEGIMFICLYILFIIKISF